LDRLEIYDDLGAPASLESGGGGLSTVNIIAGPASIGDAVITYPDVLMTDAQNLVHYRGFKFRGRSECEQGAGNNNLDRNDDLGEPVPPLQLDGGLSRTRMSTIGEQAVINHPSGAPTPFRQKDEQGAENESIQNDGDLNMGSRDLSQQSYMSRSIFSLSLFSGERSNASPRSLGGGFWIIQ